MEDEFVPLYREPKNYKDVNHNTTQLILAFNHNTTKMNKNIATMTEAIIKQGTDIKWMKRAVFGLCGLVGAIVLAACVASIGA
ncbi:MAG: hypothetical protein ACTSQA_00165 [Candidatus Heimdallarchaeaceae archaeon]